MTAIPPWLIITTLLVLITSQVLYAVIPGRRRYPLVLVLTAAGFGLGQLWKSAGLPDLHIGEADAVPGALFAAALQPLARAAGPIRLRLADVFQSRNRGK